ncbi:MAG TPA: hypothetical protein VIT67_23795, partial [Povalibacter sp.]
LETFAGSVAGFYSPEQAAAGRISATDREGNQRDFPLLTLSVAALDSNTVGATSADAMAHLLAHVKKMAKQREGNSFVLRSGERVVDLMQATSSSSQLTADSDIILMPEQLVG